MERISTLLNEKVLYPLVLISKKRYIGYLYEKDPTKYKEKLYSMIRNNDDDCCDQKNMDFVNQAVLIPYNKIEYNVPPKMSDFCAKFRNILDNEFYGMDNIKENLITCMTIV